MSNKTNIYRFRETAGSDQAGELIADGAITPGQYVYEVGGKIKRWDTAGSAAPSALFADDRHFQGTTAVDIDADYTTAETAFYSQYLPGDVVNCWIADNETVLDCKIQDITMWHKKGIEVIIILVVQIDK